MQVGAVRRLGPRLVRVTFTGGELAAFETGRPAAHLKVLFPPPGEDAPAVPSFGSGGLMFPGGAARPAMRTYTARHFDPRTSGLDVDFVLHGDGPGSTWAAHAQAGDRAVIAGPGGGYVIDPDASSYVLAGDETALPAMATILEALPDTARAEVFAEVLDPDDEMDLDSHAEIAVTWLHRIDPGILAGDLLTKAVYDRAVRADGTRVWVACEASAMRAIRRHFLYAQGLAQSVVHTRGYWKYGAEDHPDHDTGDDG